MTDTSEELEMEEDEDVKKIPSAMFASTTRRFQTLRQTERPSPGSYEVRF